MSTSNSFLPGKRSLMDVDGSPFVGKEGIRGHAFETQTGEIVRGLQHKSICPALLKFSTCRAVQPHSRCTGFENRPRRSFSHKGG